MSLNTLLIAMLISTKNNEAKGDRLNVNHALTLQKLDLSLEKQLMLVYIAPDSRIIIQNWTEKLVSTLCATETIHTQYYSKIFLISHAAYHRQNYDLLSTILSS